MAFAISPQLIITNQEYLPTQVVIITIGNKNYSIPENYILGYLLPQRKQTWSSRIILGDIDWDIGHTVLHFLYKGEYETIAYPGIQSDKSRIELEYKRSVQVYESLSIFQILRGARIIFSRFSEDKKWFYGYLHSKLSSSFVKDKTTFQLDEFYDEIADDPVLSKAVMKMVARVFTAQLSCLRHSPQATESGSEVDREPDELDICKLALAAPEEKPTYTARLAPSPNLNLLKNVMENSALKFRLNIAEAPPTLKECPSEESPVELVPVEDKEPIPNVHYEHGDNNGLGWGFAG
ncbi:uncharacterized protein ATNIH1004_001691 [Aspergillus tanneri]|uniref:Uncharacterized protein n=1 Tax=Aspergillus tanneri TaxID=1220188 RepID=A0A5M9N392_9EURO|nr:uncharacterized protein ATNIH1004_001691 [Aspergillus tanneri]KAA8652786.1 hypothetical protein ATNIH1004_001691 [Aspergillus tanneri]